MRLNGKEIVSTGSGASGERTPRWLSRVRPAVHPGRHMLCALLVLGLVVGFGLVPAGRVAAQTFTTLHNFTAYPVVTNLDGASPNGFLLSGDILYGTAQNGGSSHVGTVFKLNTAGTGFATLHDFSGSDGAQPRGELILSGNTLYGTTFLGGSSNCGTVFAINTDGTGFANFHSFTGWSGAAEPNGPLVLSGNMLYGTALAAGSSYYGTVFALNTDGTGFTNLHSFASSDGAFPWGGLILSNNVLYGTTHGDGSGSFGTVFAINTGGTGFTNLYSSSYSSGRGMQAGLILSGNTLYGTTSSGGSAGAGTVFAVHTDATGFTNLHSFTAASYPSYVNSDGASPAARLALSGNTLYGVANTGGSAGVGTVFAVHTDGSGFTNLHNFTAAYYPDYINSDGANPGAGMVLSNNTLYGTATAGGSSGQGTAFAINTDGTGFTVLHNFTATTAPSTNSDGAGPVAGLITNASGNILYGTALFGGSSGNGTVFAVNADGTGFRTLHSFTATSGPSPAANSDGAAPSAGLVLSGSTLYGTAYNGGSSGNGTVFAVNTDGTSFTTLHSFTAASATNSDGANPMAGLVLSDGLLYGTAHYGGSSGVGTVFALRTDGTGFTNLHSYNYSSDGGNPQTGLILSGNTLFGTATYGGSSGAGTVFALHTDGTGFTNLHNFNYSSDGGAPQTGLILLGNTLYGGATDGGSSGAGMLFKINPDGTGFSTLYSYTAPDPIYSTNSDGYNARGMTASGSTLYGAAYNGGSSGNGTVFTLNTDGTGFTTLHSFTTARFDGNSSLNNDGANPGGLILSGNTLYGTTQDGGSSGNGTLFSVSFRPRLTITPSGTNVVLSWPVSQAGFNYVGYILQETLNLASANGWTSVVDTNPPVIVNGQFKVTRPMLGPQWSYRLKQL